MSSSGVNQQVRWFYSDHSQSSVKLTIRALLKGAGSSIQHMLGNGGNTQPKLLKTIISSSSFLPSQYAYDDPIPEVCLCSGVPKMTKADEECLLGIVFSRR